MKTGVYQIRCCPTDKLYVGSAAISFAKRFAQHRYELRKGTHKSTYMQRSWQKYGEGAFEFSVLEVCAPAEAVAAEQRWIDKLKPAFNTAKIAGSPLGTQRTPEQRKRISEAHKGSNDHRPGKGAAHLVELVRSEEFRAAQAERARLRHASGAYANAHRLRSERMAIRHMVHGELLTLRELAERYGRTVKALQRRVERGARGDDIVAPRYEVRAA
jgi:group I intron endonuclease